MSNWVTLPNGVHIDLDDPNNPVTGDGSFESYLGGGDKSSGGKSSSKKGTSKKGTATVVKNYGMPVAIKFGGQEYPIGDEPDSKDMASIKNEYGLEKLGTVDVEGKTYEIYGSGFGNLGHANQVAVEVFDSSGSKSSNSSSKGSGSINKVLRKNDLTKEMVDDDIFDNFDLDRTILNAERVKIVSFVKQKYNIGARSEAIDIVSDFLERQGIKII